MPTIDEVARFLDSMAPAELAEEWDNVGLLVGRRGRAADRIMTCLTLTPQTVAEAVSEGAQLAIAHHPLPFRAVKRLTDESTAGRMLLDLIQAEVAVFSAHTAFDSASDGINQRLALGIGLKDIRPLVPHDAGDGAVTVGAGRHGRLAEAISVAELADRLCGFLGATSVGFVGSSERRVQQVAVACGSAGEFLVNAREAGCEAFVTGEARFHDCVEAEATGMALLLPGHYATERFAMETLAERLAEQYPSATVWASREERDPLSRWPRQDAS